MADSQAPSKRPLKVVAVIGSLGRISVTRTVITSVAEGLSARGCELDVVDFVKEPLPLFDPETAHNTDAFRSLSARVRWADVYVLGTPDYHGSISSALKNFLDHFWREFAGKLFATVVASHEKGLTVTDQLRTVARQCYAWSLPYGVSFTDGVDVQNGEIVAGPFKDRLAMFVRDVEVYGSALAAQRSVDLAGNDPGFMAKHRQNS